MVASGLTIQQANVYQRLFEITMKEGLQPSFSELCRQFKMRSRNAIKHHMKMLSQKGWIGSGEIRSRKVEFILCPDGTPFVGFTLPEDTP